MPYEVAQAPGTGGQDSAGGSTPPPDGPGRALRGTSAANAIGGAVLEPPRSDTAAGGIAALSLIPHPAAQAAALALRVVAHFDSKRKAKEAERRSTAVTLKDVRVINDPNIPIVVGLSAVPGNRAFVHISNRVPTGNAARDRGAGAVRRVIGEFIFEADENSLTKNGEPNEFLHMQYALTAGKSPGLAGARLNEFRVEVDTDSTPHAYRSTNAEGGNDVTTFGYSKVLIRDPGTASPIRSAFDSDGSTAKYEGITYCDVICQMAYDSGGVDARSRMWGQGGRLPDLLAWTWGVETRDISGGAFASERGWSENAARTMAEFVTSAQFGAGLADDRIDLGSFESVKEAADEIYVGRGGTLWTRQVPVFIGSTASPGTYGAVMANKGWAAEHNGFDSASGVDVDASDLVLRRGAYWGLISPGISFYDAMDELAQAVPGLIVWESQGRYKASLPDPFATAASQVDLTLDSSLRPEGLYAQVTEPDAADRASQVLVTYNSLNHGFKPVTAIWPEPGSAEAAALLKMNGGTEHEVEMRVPGVCSRFHATNVAMTACAMSNRRTVTDFIRFGASASLPEPGDVIRSTDALAGVDVIHRLNAVEWDETQGVIRLSGTEFVPADYAPVPCSYDVPAPVSGDPQPHSADAVLMLNHSNIVLAPGGTFDFEATMSLPIGDLVSVGGVRWQWEPLDGAGAFSNIVSNVNTSKARLTIPATQSDAVLNFAVIAVVTYRLFGTRVTTSKQYRAPFTVTVRTGATTGGTDPLSLELTPINSGAWQAATEGGDGSAITYTWTLIPSSAASIRDLTTKSTTSIGEFAEVYDSRVVEGGWVRVTVKQGTVELTDTKDMQLSHRPAFCGSD